jgi:PAS domain S-box-containing protein
MKELTREKDRAQTITSSMGEGLYVVDKNYTIVIANKVAENIVGVPIGELIGQNFLKMIKMFKGTEELKIEDRPVYKTLMTGEVESLGLDEDVYVQTLAGDNIPISISTSPLIEGKEITGVVVVFKDITSDKKSREIIERKVLERTAQLQQEKAKLSASIENMPVGFLMTDISGNLLVVNSLAHKMLGVKDDLEAYETLRKVLKGKVDIPTYLRECNENTKAFINRDVGLPDGRFIKIFLAPILTQSSVTRRKCTGIVVLIDDITEVRIIERSRDEFFSIASHELRTPLTAIRGNTSMIEDYFAKDITDPEFKSMLDDIHESAIRLIDIVNDFLNVSRLEMGKIAFRKEIFDLVKLGNEVVGELQDQASQKNLALKIGTPEIQSLNILSDRDRTKEVIVNLVGNAIKYTDKGEISIDFAPINGSTKISIKDTGQGISLEGQRLLFHKFQQAGSSILTRDRKSVV